MYDHILTRGYEFNQVFNYEKLKLWERFNYIVLSYKEMHQTFVFSSINNRVHIKFFFQLYEKYKYILLLSLYKCIFNKNMQEFIT